MDEKEEPRYLTIRETNLMIYDAWLKGEKKKLLNSKIPKSQTRNTQSNPIQDEDDVNDTPTTGRNKI